MTRLSFNNLLLIIISILLGACGGGGDKNPSGSSSSSASPIAQTLLFEQSGPLDKLVSDTIKNRAGGQGVGEVTYNSNNPDIATVDHTGAIQIKSSGMVIISATIAADDRFLAASNSYTLNIAKIDQELSFNEASPFNFTVGDSFSRAAAGTGNGTVTYSSSDESKATVNTSGVVNLVSSGTVVVTATIAADSWYKTASINFEFTIERRHQTLAFEVPTLITKDFGESSFMNIASGSGKGTITYSSSDEDVAVVDNNGLVTILGAGSAYIQAKISEDDKYSTAEASYKLLVNPITQTLAFIEPGPLEGLKGDSFTNEASGPGSGAIIYNSSDNSVATVTPNGEVQMQAPGIAVITAEKASDKNYLAASVSYTLKVGFPIAAWIGLNDTLVSLPSETFGFDFFRSSVSTCDFANYANCPHGQFNMVASNPITDSTTTLTRPGFYLFKNTATNFTHNIRADISNAASNVYAPFTARRGHQAISFNNKLWVIGGQSNNGNTLNNDIWSSTDGIIWKLEQGSAQFSARFNHKLVKLNNKLWLIGGGHQSGYFNDVWSSLDGINWVIETGAAAFSGRHSTTVTAFNNKLWVIGGYDNNYRNDVWSSSDGINWIKETNQAAFTARTQHAAVEFNNKLFLIGGESAAGRLNDVWSSTDGVTWIQETAGATFSSRITQVVVFNNQLWVVGGIATTGRVNDVWSSLDGISWAQQTSSAEFTQRAFHQVVVLDNKMFVIAGDDANAATDRDFVGDVWSSTDGIDWRIGYSDIIFP